MRQTAKRAFFDTVPVMTGYLVLGFGFGIVLYANGFGLLTAFLMSGLIYAGSMQYAAIGLLTGGASFLTAALTTLMVNARHIFYGISMLERYRGVGRRKAYLIFALTDETYSLVCRDGKGVAPERQRDYALLVSLFDHVYWVTGSLFGALVGKLVQFDSRGIDFALTALFLTVFVEQWLSMKNHLPALVGVLGSAACLIIFGSEGFLIPAMLVITLFLLLKREEEEDGLA
ncbi:MAG: AzlC family ABC transporter permease [Clostridia bacterium]|nr:AzlC family ABC transporter permease [Clostridia bacterium]